MPLRAKHNNRRLHSKSKQDTTPNDTAHKETDSEQPHNYSIQLTPIAKAKESRSQLGAHSEIHATSASMIESNGKENKEHLIQYQQLSEIKTNLTKNIKETAIIANSYQFSLFNRDEAIILKQKREGQKQMLKEELEKQILEKKKKKEEEKSIMEQQIMKEERAYTPISHKDKCRTNTPSTDTLHSLPLTLPIINSISIKSTNTCHDQPKLVEVKDTIKELDEEYQTTMQAFPKYDQSEWESMKKKIEELNHENEKLKSAISVIRERKNQSQEKIRPPLIDHSKRLKISASANQKTIKDRKRKEEDFVIEMQRVENINQKIQKANERKTQLQIISKEQRAQSIRNNAEKKENAPIQSKIPLKQYILSQQQSKKEIQSSFNAGRNLDSVCNSKWLYPTLNATPPPEFEDELDQLLKNYGANSHSMVHDNVKTHSTSINLHKSMLQSPILTTAGTLSTAISDMTSKIH